MITEVIFDLETKTFFDETGDYDPSKLGASVVSVYRRILGSDFEEKEGEMFSFWESDFAQMWPHFYEADRIIGYNSKRFDVAVLKPYSPEGFNALPHFDILEAIKSSFGKRVSLNRVAVSTLGKGKIDDPANATIYWKKQDKASLTKLQKYCEEDVILTKEVYDYGRKFGKIKFVDYWNTPREVLVDFAYARDYIPKSQKSQMGLF